MYFGYPPKSITIPGTYISLLPMDIQYLPELQDAAKDGELWNLWYTYVPRPEHMEAWIIRALKENSEGISVPFVIKRNSDNRIVGSTRYMNIEKDIRRLEIGTTWYAKSVQRSPVNTECKLLLLQHAFEDLKCRAVEFRTHRMNDQSRKAIARLGAQQDGILRNHRIASDGTIRDTVVYSIIDSEWPSVKSNLSFMLNKKY
ncbi:MAG TPA: GNAT family protein [Flavitalea sp.]|nr:GNAT family protein [Flavitalea sp.]